MTADVQVLSPTTLGFWVRCLRTASHLSQEALAAASGLTPRTIQRIEAGRPTSITTRRSLARGLGYDNADVFEDPTFAANVHELLATIADTSEQQQFPNHVKVAASPVRTGEHLGYLVGSCSAYGFNCDNDLPPEVKETAAALFDLLQDYGDCWTELSNVDRLEAMQTFAANLAEFGDLGARLYMAIRSTTIVGAMWADKTPMPMTIGYLTVVAETREIEHLLVPKGL